MKAEERANFGANQVVQSLLRLCDKDHRSAVRATHDDWYDLFLDVINDTIDKDQYKQLPK